MGYPFELLVFQRLLDRTNLSHRGGRTAERFADAEDAKGPDLEPRRIRILLLHGRPDLPAKSRLNDGLEGCFPTDSQGLGLHQKVIRKDERCFHNMGERMGVRLAVKLGLFSGWLDSWFEFCPSFIERCPS